MREIIPTIVPEIFEQLEAKIAQLRAFSRALHIDVGDGRFVPNTTWLPNEDEKIPAINAILFEAHLMVQDPLPAGIAFAHAGVSRIIAHVESFSDPSHIAPTFEAWRAAGAAEISLALTIDTTLDDAAPFLILADGMHMMTIGTIGTQGNIFEDRSLEKIRAAAERFPLLPISVDGGIDEKNIVDVAKAGATRMCVGSALANADDPAALYQRLMEAANAV